MTRRTNNLRQPFWLAALALTWITAADRQAQAQIPNDKEVHIRFSFGSEKKAWLIEATEAFHKAETKTNHTKKSIKVTLEAMGSGQAVEEVLQARREWGKPPGPQPTPRADLISPASEIYIRLANAGKLPRPPGLEPDNGDWAIVGQTESLVKSPIVIGMWEQYARAFGWDNKAKPAPSWSRIFDLATDPKGWDNFDCPNLGQFIFAHTNPHDSNSGLLAIIVQALAAKSKATGLPTRGLTLTVEDVGLASTREFLLGIARTISQYGESTGFLGNRMIAGDPRELHAAVMYESVVIDSYTRLKNPTRPDEVIWKSKNPTDRLVAIYPEEGTFMSDHPVGIVDAPWVSQEQRDAADVYINYLRQVPSQVLAMKHGFRPGDAKIPLSKNFAPKTIVDLEQPKQDLLVLPDLDVIAAVRDLWRKSKKKSDVVLAIDVSNSMSLFGKIGQAKKVAAQISESFGEEDRLSILTFGDNVTWRTESLPMKKGFKEKSANIVNGLVLENRTRLYDGVREAWNGLLQQAGPDRISLVIVLSDGMDTLSGINLAALEEKLQFNRLKPVIIVTIGYGKDANPVILKQIADLGRGFFEKAEVATLQKVVEKVAAIGVAGSPETEPKAPGSQAQAPR